MKVGGCYIILTTLINAHHWFPQQPAPLKRPSAADIIGRRSQPTSSPQTLPAPPTSRSLPPAATPGKTSPPASPPLEVSSPLNPPKQALLSTASISVFEHFKKQALEKNERVSCAVQIEVDSVSVCVCCRIVWPSSRRFRGRSRGDRRGLRPSARKRSCSLPPHSRASRPRQHPLLLGVWRTLRADRNRERDRERSSAGKERL